MPITVTTNENTTRIIISDLFDYSVHTDFRTAYRDTPTSTIFIIDMAQVSYMDSAALGMLLLLREHIGDDPKKISIVSCNPEIKNIFTVAKFHNLFTIS